MPSVARDGAVAHINRRWSLSGPRSRSSRVWVVGLDIVYHETPEYWAAHHYTQDGSPQSVGHLPLLGPVSWVGESILETPRRATCGMKRMFGRPVMLRSAGIGEQRGDHRCGVNGGWPVTDLPVAEFDDAPYAVGA